jgi:hypothetical protein
MLFKVNRNLNADMQRFKLASRSMAQASARREQQLQHVPQAQRCAGSFPTPATKAGGGPKASGTEARRAAHKSHFRRRGLRTPDK